MKRIYQTPVTEIDYLISADNLLQDGTSTQRVQIGGTYVPEDGGKSIPTSILETDGGDSPYSNGQGYGIRANSGLWED